MTHPVSANGHYFRPENIQALEAALDGYDAKIVISSTWRLDFPLPELREKLGEKLGARVIGVTPEINEPFLHSPRQAEVELYLAQDEVEQWPWLAIDDTRAFYKADTAVVFTNSQTGFQTSNVQLFRDTADRLLLSVERTYLIDHPEEGVVLAIVTNKVMKSGEYISVLPGKAEEYAISAKLRMSKHTEKPIIYIFDEQ